MIDTAVSRCFLRMTIQAVGRIGTQGNGAYDSLSRTIMTGGTGTYPVGGHIVLSSLNFSPTRYNMAGAAGNTIRKVAGTQFNCMGMGCMNGVKGTRMAGGAVASHCKRLADGQADQGTCCCIVTTCTTVVGISSTADQGIIMTASTAGSANCY
jgi:hypothetical protein